MAERLLRNQTFELSQNAYDWLGEGIYFWEANPLRGLEFAVEVAKREPKKIKKPTVIGAVIDLGYCLDLTTSRGLRQTRAAYDELTLISDAAGLPLPINEFKNRKHNLDCAVINYVHRIQSKNNKEPFDSVKGIFIEDPVLYSGSAFYEKNHIQIAVRNHECIKGVFRVPKSHLDPDV